MKGEMEGGREGRGKKREIGRRNSKYLFKKEKPHVINNLNKSFWQPYSKF